MAPLWQRNLKKLQKIKERSLRFVFNDNDSNYMQLLYRVGQPSLFNGRVHYILSLVYKSVNGGRRVAWSFLKVRTSTYDLET